MIKWIIWVIPENFTRLQRPRDPDHQVTGQNIMIRFMTITGLFILVCIYLTGFAGETGNARCLKI